MNYRQPGMGGIPPVVKNILILNVIFYVATFLFASININLTEKLALYYFQSNKFQPYQLVSYMFMHDTNNFMHILFNMLAVWMLGSSLESVWGPKRFLTYYMITGIGAAVIHMTYMYFDFSTMFETVGNFNSAPDPNAFVYILKENFQPYLKVPEIQNFITSWLSEPSNPLYIQQGISYVNELVDMKINTPTVGASGAVFGILIAFGMLFPNTPLMLLFFPFPIKAKYFVIMYGALELVLGIMDRPGDNVAHFAHLGGALFGFIMVKIWNSSRNNFY